MIRSRNLKIAVIAATLFAFMAMTVSVFAADSNYAFDFQLK